jgi:hypothetical protein
MTDGHKKVTLNRTFLEDSPQISLLTSISRQPTLKNHKKLQEIIDQKEQKRSEYSSDKRKYRYISDLERLKLILLITEHNFNCSQAAKKLNIPYTNAKVIFKMFKEEGRVHQKPRREPKQASND